MKEKTIYREAKKYVHERGGVAIKQHGGVFGEIGIPDLLVCYKGRFVAAEAKRPGEKPSAIQLLQIDRINQAGGVAFLFSSLAEFVEGLKAVDK